jgi:hypothetical protein
LFEMEQKDLHAPSEERGARRKNAFAGP